MPAGGKRVDGHFSAAKHDERHENGLAAPFLSHFGRYAAKRGGQAKDNP
jgi:hypothetical protein